MAFCLNLNLVFIDSMKFINSSLEKLVKNLSDNDFKYLTKEIVSKNIALLKQKDAYMKLPDKKCFYSSVKDERTGDNGEKLNGHISDKDYLTGKIWVIIAIII